MKMERIKYYTFWIHKEYIKNLSNYYISNVSYFKKYFKDNKSNICVAGRIEEKNSQKILMDIYKVNIYFIPRTSKKQLRIYGLIIADNK